MRTNANGKPLLMAKGTIDMEYMGEQLVQIMVYYYVDPDTNEIAESSEDPNDPLNKLNQLSVVTAYWRARRQRRARMFWSTFFYVTLFWTPLGLIFVPWLKKCWMGSYFLTGVNGIVLGCEILLLLLWLW